MQGYRVTLQPKSAFGTPLKGDTLFGQLCWSILNRYGQHRLKELLSNYRGQPFAVCSDGFPSGYFPRPTLPGRYFDMADDADRKAMKKKHWIPLDDLTQPVSMWLTDAKTDPELLGEDITREQPHNSIDHLSGATPYSQAQTWYRVDMKFDLYLLLDESRLPLSDMETLLTDMGAFGYGRDASIGLGKFRILNIEQQDFSPVADANACLTLAPCAPQGLGLDSERSYYKVFTRFGRHGDLAAHGRHGPFKAPVLLADTAAVFSPMPADKSYIGQGLGGGGELSKTIPATVHQGYAPHIPIHLPELKQVQAA